MSAQKDFKELTSGLGVEDDCPVCGMSWPMCQGLCAAHESMTGHPGPFHTDYNDDCPECKEDEVVCRECGEPCFLAVEGTSHHYSADTPDNIDHDADAKHVAIPETPPDCGKPGHDILEQCVIDLMKTLDNLASNRRLP